MSVRARDRHYQKYGCKRRAEQEQFLNRNQSPRLTPIKTESLNERNPPRITRQNPPRKARENPVRKARESTPRILR
jgi:hypothetical protein